MTEEEKIQHLRALKQINDPLSQTSIALEAAIELMESQSDDCVSRKVVIEALDCEIHGSIESDIDLSEYQREFQEFANMIMDAQEKAIRALPSVTPTHGACKDCKHYRFLASDGKGNTTYTCDKLLKNTREDFYCADFEKSEVVKNEKLPMVAKTKAKS